MRCKFLLDPQATHIFILVAIPEAGYCKIYLDQEQ